MNSVYQTGANTYEVNSLLIWADNTRELVKLRDDICTSFVGKPSIEAKEFTPLYKKACESLTRELKRSDNDLLTFTKAHESEFCELYALDFKAWKFEHDFADWDGNDLPPIQRLRVQGYDILLPDEQLDRNVYLDIKNKLEKIGGKYNTKIKGFSFKSDPTSLLGKLQKGESIDIKQDFQFFETPVELAQKIVQLADIQPNHDVLEPSAGMAAIAREVPRFAKVDVCELMEENAIYLQERSHHYNFMGRDFLTVKLPIQYDRIVANPPFSNNQDIDHIRKMFEVLKPGGRMVTIASASWSLGSNKKQIEFREWLFEIGAQIEDIESGAFKQSGTTVATKLIIIDKAA